MATDPLLATLQSLLCAVAVGLLVGLDRERAEVRKHQRLFAGIRTFPLIALAGAIPMLLLDRVGAALVVVSFTGVAVVAAIAFIRGSAAGDVGATTEIAALATFLLGTLAGSGQLTAAAAAGVMVTVLLHAKPTLEGFSRTLTAEEMLATLELAVITVIVLPVLPDRGYGPWNALNPHEIWLVVVLVSALSFAGFAAMRFLGAQRGLLVTGALGGLVSSTAVTMAMAERSREGTASSAPAAAAVLASTVMCGRVALLASVVAPALVTLVAPAMGAMAAIGTGAAWWLGRAKEPGAPAPQLGNPFSLRAAVVFGAVYALVLLVVQGAQALLGDSGSYLAAALAGIADVDAPTIAFGRQAQAGFAASAAVLAITIAAISNTLVKLGLAVTLGTGPFRRQVAVPLAVMALAGGLVAGFAWAHG